MIMQNNEKIDASSFEIIGIAEDQGDIIARPRVGYFKDAWRRFKENKVALIAMCILLLLIVMVIVGPALSGYGFESVDKAARNQGPLLVSLVH